MALVQVVAHANEFQLPKDMYDPMDDGFILAMLEASQAHDID